MAVFVQGVSTPLTPAQAGVSGGGEQTQRVAAQDPGLRRDERKKTALSVIHREGEAAAGIKSKTALSPLHVRRESADTEAKPETLPKTVR